MKVETPLFVPVLAALPVAACMAILGLPVFGYEYAAAFRSLYFVACLVWLIPLALLQRAMWRCDWPWLRMALVLLAASYAMSILNAVLGQGLGIWLGLQKHYRWNELAEGLDGCWLALIAFCAVHAVAAYYLSLQQVRLQVNPHFLFNSLNAISALVSAQSNREANRMLGCVADFLRATLAHDGRHEHSLAEELALLDAYLKIEQARLGERLCLNMKAGPDLLDNVMPYLMLQPLVENAIRHGIAPLSVPGRLDIRLEHVGERLLVEVRNDGQQPAQPGCGIGLANVRERLRHLYGDDQEVEAGWGQDGRFGVRIALPLRSMAAAA
jgi:hypothetical protein